MFEFKRKPHKWHSDILATGSVSINCFVAVKQHRSLSIRYKAAIEKRQLDL